jgi:hypothetical protein
MNKGYIMTHSNLAALALAVSLVLSQPALAGKSDKNQDFDNYGWNLVTEPAPWTARAGLEAVLLDGDFYILGGRTPNEWVPPPAGPIPGDSTLWGDVWRSTDRGQTWDELLATDDASHWAARAYHEVVTKDGRMVLIGGQNFGLIPNPECDFNPACFPAFIPVSEFFNDVWSSPDGINWTLLTGDAGWQGRAGLSAAVFKDRIFVMGGSFNDDPDIVGGPPVRVLFNDVWSSEDGVHWTQLTDNAPWAPRAGAAVVVKNGYLWLLGGEFGFFGFPPPYFNDVWRTRDGVNWELVTPAADWSPRPGHTCDVLRNHIVCFGGFGQSDNPADPFAPANPMDVWVSRNGADWTMLTSPPWNAAGPGEVKYDYDTVVAPAGPEGRGLAIYTFGGDRETFDFFDPLQWLNVDNDVWKFSLYKD